jgi:hypothetical protein
MSEAQVEILLNILSFAVVLVIGVFVLIGLRWLAVTIGNLLKTLSIRINAFLVFVLSRIGVALFVIKRGRLTVRASTYLLLIEGGADVLEANKAALSIDTYAACELRRGAVFHLEERYQGKQLALISAARLNGFLG